MVAWLRADPRRGDLLLAIITVAVGVLLIEASPQEFDTGWPEVAAGVGAFVLVLARRTQPLLLLAVGLLWGGVHVATLDRPAPLFFAVLVLLVTACVRLDRRPAIAVGIVVAVALYTFGLWVNESQFADDRVVIGIVWADGAVGIADATRCHHWNGDGVGDLGDQGQAADPLIGSRMRVGTAVAAGLKTLGDDVGCFGW